MTHFDRSRQDIDFAELYDAHNEYIARRVAGSFEQALINLEAVEFKIPNLIGLLPPNKVLTSALEIGCATGELIGNFPVVEGGHRCGCDISRANIEAAATRFRDVDFHAGDFAKMALMQYEGVILSDVLEHVENDVDFLRRASSLGSYCLLNLPLEDNWLNSGRRYGPDDLSGHLRRYSLQDGLDLVNRAGLTVLKYRQVWIHETELDSRRRKLRESYSLKGFSGNFPVRLLKRAVFSVARISKPFGRRLFASNLFVLARK